MDRVAVRVRFGAEATRAAHRFHARRSVRLSALRRRRMRRSRRQGEGVASSELLSAQDGAEGFDPPGYLRQMRHKAGFAAMGADGIWLHAAVRGFLAFDGQGYAGV